MSSHFRVELALLYQNNMENVNSAVIDTYMLRLSVVACAMYAPRGHNPSKKNIHDYIPLLPVNPAWHNNEEILMLTRFLPSYSPFCRARP